MTDMTLLDDALAVARSAGADAADALLVRRQSLEVSWRLGDLEELERKEDRDLGLRVFVGRRQACGSTSRLDPDSLRGFVRELVASAAHLPEDRWAGIADPEELAGAVPDLDLVDAAEPTPEQLMERAAAAEDAGRAVPGISNSQGASASWSRSIVMLAASNGLRCTYGRTAHRLGATMLAGSGTAMERDSEYRAATHLADLPPPEAVGRLAGERTVRRLSPRKAATASVPVVFDPRVAGSLVGPVVSAANGAAIARKTSFLKDRLGQQLFAKGIRIVDDPLRMRGLRSQSFDAEGVATKKLAVIDDGVLTAWLLDSATARELGLTTTGHAHRGVSSSPSPGSYNLHLEAGELTPRELIADVEQGFYVTDLIGSGVNGVTGDYSRGASGFWIENGEITYPVSEITIAGHLIEMFKSLTPANDLAFRYGTNAPTVRIEGLTVGGL